MYETRQIVGGLALMLGLAANAASAQSKDLMLEEAKAVSASVQKVEAGGYWSRGEEEGFFRIVVIAGGVEHVAHRLYLQWLTIDPDTQDHRVVGTTPVKEINEGHGAILEVTPDFDTMGELELAIKASPGRGPEKRFVLTAQATVGVYSLRTQ